MRRYLLVDETVVIERLVPGGHGMGRLRDGRPVFAEQAFTGDVLRLEGVEDRKSFVFARKFDVVTPANSRRTPPCSDCKRCGGCDWMWIDDGEQLRGKADLITQALERVGRIAAPGPIFVRPSPRTQRYRSRIRLQVKGGRVGFFARGSHELVEVSDCLVSSEEVWQLVRDLRQVVKEHPGAFVGVTHAEVRVLEGLATMQERASVHVSLSPSRSSAPKRKQMVSELRKALLPLESKAAVRIGPEATSVQGFFPVPDVRVLAPIGGFTQVNEPVNRQIVERVVAEATRVGAKRFLDLYCGSGNFSLPLLHRGLEGTGVEYSAEAIEMARRQADASGLNGRFIAQACDEYLRELREGATFDVVIVDPPRAGAKGVISELLRLRPPHLLMIACDPASLARDLGELVRGGYRLDVVEGFDMFPQTHHVETLAILRTDESPRLSEPAS